MLARAWRRARLKRFIRRAGGRLRTVVAMTRSAPPPLRPTDRGRRLGGLTLTPWRAVRTARLHRLLLLGALLLWGGVLCGGGLCGVAP